MLDLSKIINPAMLLAAAVMALSWLITTIAVVCALFQINPLEFF